jgi:hypothetical protein
MLKSVHSGDIADSRYKDIDKDLLHERLSSVRKARYSLSEGQPCSLPSSPI